MDFPTLPVIYVQDSPGGGGGGKRRRPRGKPADETDALTPTPDLDPEAGEKRLLDVIA